MERDDYDGEVFFDYGEVPDYSGLEFSNDIDTVGFKLRFDEGEFGGDLYEVDRNGEEVFRGYVNTTRHPKEVSADTIASILDPGMSSEGSPGSGLSP